MDIFAKITAIKYKPFLCRKLPEVEYKDFEGAFNEYASFILKVDDVNKIAVSWWVSSKRTRSYPYARVYDTFGFSGKRMTIIPIIKDEGKEGDRDFLQWDTVSLMSLFGVYVIVSYYNKAEQSTRYRHKITNQRFDIGQIRNEINKLLQFQSDALHWNLQQIENAGNIGEKALESYENISGKTKVEMHSKSSAEKRVKELLKGKDVFMNLSRGLAKQAQYRESQTIQPKESLTGVKAVLTINNYLGGHYYFTVDEAEIMKNSIMLVEGKHSKSSILPSLEDIKDGLLKMVLFTNLEDVTVGKRQYIPIAILKLSSKIKYVENKLSKSQKLNMELLKDEASVNGFKLSMTN